MKQKNYLKSWQKINFRGFTTKIHAVGDYAIHTALNVTEKLERKMDLVA